MIFLPASFQQYMHVIMVHSESLCMVMVCLLPPSVPSEPNFTAIIPDEQAIILKCGMYLRIKKQILRENWKGIETTICNNKNCDRFGSSPVAMVTEYS